MKQEPKREISEEAYGMDCRPADGPVNSQHLAMMPPEVRAAIEADAAKFKAKAAQAA